VLDIVHYGRIMNIQALMGLAIAASLCLPAYAQEGSSPADAMDWNLSGASTDRSMRKLSWAERDLRTEAKWSVSDLVSTQRCSAPLRATLFTEIFQHQSASAEQNSLKYIWCKTDVGSESEAKTQNIKTST
jgi:hypothetical protein